MSPLTATAIVVTHNSANHIGDALAPLRQAGIAVRVVDNASRDATVALVAATHPEVELTANRHNVGFASAVNQALRDVATDVVLLVNPDCVLPAATVQALVAYLRARPEVGIAGPRLVDADGRVTNSAHPFESLRSVIASRFGGNLVPVAVRQALSGARRRSHYRCRDASKPVGVDWLSGACLAIRTELLARVGGLDEGYFLYYEDEELCLRARQHGAEVVYLPTVQAMHVGGASSADPSQLWPHLYRSMLRFFARNRRDAFHAVRAAVVLRAVVGIGLAAA
ncbi:MAG TPA: glycosyltransferase family 2 protein, partial [Rugosimonospora sp.]|nr:glycosyltransferase family 2 protein [Rugosimonospora sp.]